MAARFNLPLSQVDGSETDSDSEEQAGIRSFIMFSHVMSENFAQLKEADSDEYFSFDEENSENEDEVHAVLADSLFTLHRC
jgi:hypothetical protein